MKKLILIFLLVAGFMQVAIADDRIIVQVQFKKGIFACPGGDEIVDWSPSGGNEYSHTCSDGTWLNQFKEYNGILNYFPEEYEAKTEEDIKDAKNVQLDKWIYDIEHPPVYIEPSLTDLQNMYNDKIKEATEYLELISKKTTEIELEKNKTEGKIKIDQVKK